MPASFATVKVTLYTPGFVNVWVAFVACFELVPSPMSQYQEFGTPPVLKSVNRTTKGTVPEVTFAVNAATGGKVFVAERLLI